MIWEAVIITYLLLGLFTTWMASIGHKLIYGTSYGWPAWIAGTVGWPIAFLIGGRKK